MTRADGNNAESLTLNWDKDYLPQEGRMTQTKYMAERKTMRRRCKTLALGG